MAKDWHILLIESDSFLLSMYKAKFEQAGWRVSVADNGLDGLVEAKRKKPDIIMLEVLLEQTDGFTVLAELKKDRQTTNIPVVFLTSLGQKQDVEKGLALGAIEYLIKAYCQPSETIVILNRILESH